MDIAYLISMMPYAQDVALGLPDDFNTQCATTMPLQMDLSRVVDQARIETLQWVLVALVWIVMLKKCFF